MKGPRIFTHVKMRALIQSQRFVVFRIVDVLVAGHRQGEIHFAMT